MRIECSADLLGFAPVDGRKVVAGFGRDCVLVTARTRPVMFCWIRADEAQWEDAT
jgi:hypothetical protein